MNKICFLTIFIIFSSCASSKKTQEPLYQYTTTMDWFSWNIPNWRQALVNFKGKHDLKYLEIGVLEGRSAFWMFDNILTHSSSEMTLIDAAALPNLTLNIRNHPRKNQIKLIIGLSQNELRKLPQNYYDIIYIDASHMANDVYLDAALSWGLLKEGGILIFDDYTLSKNTRPLPLRPQVSIDAFLAAFDGHYEKLLHEYQVILKKKVSKYYDCTPFAEFVYCWNINKILNQAGEALDVLNKSEVELLRQHFINKTISDYVSNNPKIDLNLEKLYFKLRSKN